MGLYSLHILSHVDDMVLVASCSDLGRLGCGKVAGELHCDKLLEYIEVLNVKETVF